MNENLLNIEANIEAQDKDIYKVFLTAIFAAAACVLTVLFMFISGGMMIFFPFLAALIFDISGFVMLSKLKAKHYEYSSENRLKLKVTRIILWLIFIGLVISFLTAAAFLIYIGMYGFGR